MTASPLLIFCVVPSCGAKLPPPGGDASHVFGVDGKAVPRFNVSEPTAPVIVLSRRKPFPPELPFQFSTRYIVEIVLSKVTAGTCELPVVSLMRVNELPAPELRRALSNTK